MYVTTVTYAKSCEQSTRYRLVLEEGENETVQYIYVYTRTSASGHIGSGLNGRERGTVSCSARSTTGNYDAAFVRFGIFWPMATRGLHRENVYLPIRRSHLTLPRDLYPLLFISSDIFILRVA